MKRYVPVFAIAFVLIGAVIATTSMHQYWLKEGLAVIWTDDIDALSDEICDDADNDKQKLFVRFFKCFLMERAQDKSKQSLKGTV